MNRDGRSCEVCAKAHLAVGGNLECRAGPPLPDIARFARFPAVQPDFYCHDKFERDPERGATEENSQ